MLYHIVGCSKGYMPYESKYIVYCTSLSLFTNICVSIAVVSHLWRSLRHIVSYSKGWMPYEGECTVYCECPKKSMYLPKKVCRFSRPFQLIIQLYSQKPHWLYLKHVPPFTLLPQRQMLRKKAGNTSCCPTPWFTFNLPDNRQFVLEKSWEVELVS